MGGSPVGYGTLSLDGFTASAMALVKRWKEIEVDDLPDWTWQPCNNLGVTSKLPCRWRGIWCWKGYTTSVEGARSKLRRTLMVFWSSGICGLVLLLPFFALLSAPTCALNIWQKRNLATSCIVEWAPSSLPSAAARGCPPFQSSGNKTPAHADPCDLGCTTLLPPRLLRYGNDFVKSSYRQHDCPPPGRPLFPHMSLMFCISFSVLVLPQLIRVAA